MVTSTGSSLEPRLSSNFSVRKKQTASDEKLDESLGFEAILAVTVT